MSTIRSSRHQPTPLRPRLAPRPGRHVLKGILLGSLASLPLSCTTFLKTDVVDAAKANAPNYLETYLKNTRAIFQIDADGNTALHACLLRPFVNGEKNTCFAVIMQAVHKLPPAEQQRFLALKNKNGDDALTLTVTQCLANEFFVLLALHPKADFRELHQKLSDNLLWIRWMGSGRKPEDFDQKENTQIKKLEAIDRILKDRIMEDMQATFLQRMEARDRQRALEKSANEQKK